VFYGGLCYQQATYITKREMRNKKINIK